MGVEGPCQAKSPPVDALCLRVLQSVCPREGWREAGSPGLTGLRVTSIEALEGLLVHEGAPDLWL